MVEMNEFTLKVEKLVASCMVDQRIFIANSEVMAEEMANQLVMQLRVALASQELETVTHAFEVEYPENWYQHFRQRWFPKSWLEKHPVKMKKETKTVHFTVKAYYPELALPDKPYTIRVAKYPNSKVVPFDPRQWEE